MASAVFIDDNPAERERARGAFPDVLVPEWPSDPAMYVSSLRALDCFDSVALSKEDRGRTAMYKAERERRETKAIVTSLDDWLLNLETKLEDLPILTILLMFERSANSWPLHSFHIFPKWDYEENIRRKRKDTSID